MYLIVGLGNPGPKYASQRHNVGFMVIDRVAASCRADAFRDKWKGEFVRTSLAGTDVVLLKPLTYMNLSGESVLGAMTFFKVPPANVLVVHDEMDLAYGDVRLKMGGGIAGHNGLRSIVQHCGPDFPRLRIGIGHPGDRAEVANWVLKKPAPDQRPLIEDSIAHSLKAWPALLAGDMDKATLLVHTTKAARSKPPRPATGAPEASV